MIVSPAVWIPSFEKHAFSGHGCHIRSDGKLSFSSPLEAATHQGAFSPLVCTLRCPRQLRTSFVGANLLEPVEVEKSIAALISADARDMAVHFGISTGSMMGKGIAIGDRSQLWSSLSLHSQDALVPKLRQRSALEVREIDTADGNRR
nr:hypothetical protein CFP56_16644 [Quercus suber]